MDRSTPALNSDYTIEAIINISSELSQYNTVNDLSICVDNEEAITLILKILNSLLCRVFEICICDPVVKEITIETKSEETQTVIQYNCKIDYITLDSETQTKLTCEPRHSNSKLLAKYEEAKNCARSILQECFIKGIESRIIIDDLIEEIIEKGGSRVKYPRKHQLIQTITTYKSHEDKEEDILRKLRMHVVVDPLEASIVVVPLIDELLCLIQNQVSRDARRIIKKILNPLIQQTILIGQRLAEIRKQPQISIEQIFNQRRKRIIESMQKETATIAIQTGLAGVPKVAKIKEPKKILCDICDKQSVCHWCLTAKKETEKKSRKSPSVRLLIPQHVSCEKLNNVSNEVIEVVLTPKKIPTRDSISGWAQIIDNTLINSWSFKDSTNSGINNAITTSCTARTISKSCCGESHPPEDIMNPQTTKALQILKSTFCTRDNCPAISPEIFKKNHAFNKNADDHLSCSLENCKLLNLTQRSGMIFTNSNTNEHICAKLRNDKFRVYPVRSVSESRGRM